MRRALCVCVAACVVVGLGVGSMALANMAVKGNDPGMMVSPHTIVLAKVSAVTVHTNIPAGSVVSDSVTLNGATPLAVWADDCGHLAARFAVADLDLVPGDAVLVLSGTYTGETAETFSAEDAVKVK